MSGMQAKYHMTREENIFVARRNIIDYIWKSARLEGLAVTYPSGAGERRCGKPGEVKRGTDGSMWWGRSTR